MKAVVGIDSGGGFDPAINLLARFRFPNLHVDLLHCIESSVVSSRFPDALGPEHPFTEMHEEYEKEGRRALQQAADYASSKGLPCDQHITCGPPARALIEFADRHGSDLIVIRSFPKPFYHALFFGSVARAVVTGAQQSVLIAKGDVAAEGALNVIIATDHSDYCSKALEELLRMGPKGIARAQVVTANEIETGVAALLVRGLPMLSKKAPAWIREKLEELNREVADRLAPLAPERAGVVIDGHPNDVIREQMESTGADLLIMGAQGHGFFHRLKFGSKSFHQLVSETYPLLILRPKEDA